MLIVIGLIKLLKKIINVFKEDLYNPLLQYFYLSSEENYLISHITNNVYFDDCLWC